MAASPKFKIFDSNGCYQASCKQPEAAACLAGMYGNGATVRTGHRKKDIVWTEGADGDAADSVDIATEVILQRQADKAHSEGVRS